MIPVAMKTAREGVRSRSFPASLDAIQIHTNGIPAAAAIAMAIPQSEPNPLMSRLTCRCACRCASTIGYSSAYGYTPVSHRR